MSECKHKKGSITPMRHNKELEDIQRIGRVERPESFTITHTHNRLRYGTFPIDDLTELEGITVEKKKGCKLSEEIYLITVDMSKSAPDETVQDIAFELGMLIQMHLLNK